MNFTVNDFEKFIGKIIPIKHGESWDNVGLLVGKKETEITGVLLALDCTLEVIEEAIEKECNLIFTHHPVIFSKQKSVSNETLTGKKIIKLIENELAVYSAHTNLDSIEGGLNEIACQMVSGKKGEIIEVGKDENTGIGRIVELDKEIDFEAYVCNVKEIFELEGLRFGGDGQKKIKKVAIINGSGEDYIEQSMELGADCVITGDTKYHLFSDSIEQGMCIIDGGHFGIENKLLMRYSEKLSDELKAIGFNGKVIYSEKQKSPYKFMV